MITGELRERLAKALFQAQEERRQLEPLTDERMDLTLEDAYSIQLALLSERLKQGARVVGKKLGCTNSAAQQMLGVSEPVFGYLLDDRVVSNGAELQVERLIQPKVEGEVAFVLAKDLRGPGITRGDVIAATGYIAPAIEIADSRFRDWKIKLADFVSDNVSSGMFVIGDSKAPADRVDIPQAEMEMEKNGEIIARGKGDAVMGDPALGVAWLANKLAEMGAGLSAGEIILSGSLVMPQPVSKGDRIKVTFKDFGSASVHFV
ncbi:MAG TPA: fumarylacetoacetate hydrolase family protein [Blastocatellia bacterium]|nr:fumarylacetoacetate hydrolase family protein [Blastocatellia bacterium]